MISPVGSVVPSYCTYDVYISKDDVPAQLGERKLDPQNERLHTLQRLKLQTTRLSVAMGQSHPQAFAELEPHHFRSVANWSRIGVLDSLDCATRKSALGVQGGCTLLDHATRAAHGDFALVGRTDDDVSQTPRCIRVFLCSDGLLKKKGKKAR